MNRPDIGTVFFFVNFEITILGCGAATPTNRHAPTAQLVNVHDKFFLVDCGEGTQMQLRKFRFKFQRINHIFISHLHGDHYLGLMGLISSMHLLGRSKELHLYAPPQIREILEVQFRASETRLSFEIVYHNSLVSEKTLLLEDRTLEVYGFPLKHRIPTTGYLFIEKERKRKMEKDTIRRYALSVEEIIALKNNQDVNREGGDVLRSKELTSQPVPARSYAFCSDTALDQKVIESVAACNLLYHEATFLHELATRAKETFHSTAAQAGEVAKQAKVCQLVIGHFSSRYTDEKPLLDEARSRFPNVLLAHEGLVLVPPVPHKAD